VAAFLKIDNNGNTQSINCNEVCIPINKSMAHPIKPSRDFEFHFIVTKYYISRGRLAGKQPFLYKSRAIARNNEPSRA